MSERRSSNPNETKTRLLWTVGSYVVIYSRSDKQYYDGKIEKIIFENDEKQSLSNEWLIVRYKDNKKTKNIQRNCKDIKSIPEGHILSLQKGSLCLIYSHHTLLWCKGQIISVFNDNEGEWLRVKYFNTKENKMCDIQRYSKDLHIFEAWKQWKPVVKIATPNKPWKILQTNVEIISTGLSNIIQLNKNEFIVAPMVNVTEEKMKTINGIYKSRDKTVNGIYKYNVIENKWKLFIEYPETFYSEYHTVSIDYNNDIIYLYNSQCGNIWKIDIKTKKFECFATDIVGALTFVINSQLHLFWGLNHGKHVIFDKELKTFDVIKVFEDMEKGMISFGMVYNEQKEYFLLFGGYKGNEIGNSDEIWKYIINEQKWEKLKVKMPKKMESFGCVISLNGECVIIFGGSDSSGIVNKIYVLNLMRMEWKESNVLCPFEGVGYGNVFISVSDNVEYVNLLQGNYSHIIQTPLSEIL
eukprot:327473_1